MNEKSEDFINGLAPSLAIGLAGSLVSLASGIGPIGAVFGSAVGTVFAYSTSSTRRKLRPVALALGAIIGAAPPVCLTVHFAKQEATSHRLIVDQHTQPVRPVVVTKSKDCTSELNRTTSVCLPRGADNSSRNALQ